AMTRHSMATLRALGFSDAAALHVLRPPDEQVLRDLQWLEESGACLLPFTAAAYPPALAALPDAPPALYVLGDVGLLGRPQLAIVGSRHPTAAGRRFAADIAAPLCAAGLVITSGLARGIDAAAHEAALRCGGRTIAVCGTGLDQCYPPQHRSLFARIREQGALVSEFAPRSPALPHHFPRRNRIISGLSCGVAVIEAAAGSGSLITARRALDQGRELFAVPGSPLNPLAAGCLELLREGAHLLCDADDILGEISISRLLKDQSNHGVEIPRAAAPGRGRLDKDYEMLLDALGFEPASINDLVDRTDLAAGNVASMMLILELDGRVEILPGALYNRIS
ncbi:MAG: DNA-processing protein DprA, partial [Steroidobacteraceae bacterium]